MIKLYKARSLLYRRQILQENIRWKALDEIYKIYMLLHRSDLNISENFRQTFSHFSAICLQILIIFIEFCSDFDEKFSEFRHDDDKVDHTDDEDESNHEVKDREKRPAKPAKRRLSEPKPICTINPNVKKVSPKAKKAKSTSASKEK